MRIRQLQSLVQLGDNGHFVEGDCLDMIVRNEMADLEGCHGSVATQFKSQVTGDADSIDGGRNFARSCPGVRAVLHEPHRRAYRKPGHAHNERRCDKGSV